MEVLRGSRTWPHLLLGRDYDPDAGLAAAERAGAWEAWKRAVVGISPQAIIRAVDESGLRGRGGAGFPTGRKWRACAAQEGAVRYVVANGFEADPGAQVDRTLMERDPHLVVEGVALAAYAVGAGDAYVVVKQGHGAVTRRLRAAIRAAEEAGYLGSDVLGRGFDLQVEVREVPGGFVVGEETVLLQALENKRAQPEQRPPFPAVRGLWGKPTVVNNVETLAAVPWIVANGAASFAAVGGPDAPGTTLVQVSGAVGRPGIIEAPLGTPVKELVQVARGRRPGLRRIKAVLVGGPSGGFLPPAGLGIGLGAQALESAGAILGSGTVLVVDDTACIVSLAALMTRYLNDEACGKTIPCRIGTRRLAEIGARFTAGTPRPTDPQLLSDLAADCRDGALCALESTATNPLMSGMRYFGEEFEDHIVRGTCPAGVCRPVRVAAGAVQ
jgi:NADH-quinone oxidoreductase subunit F